MYAIIIYYGHLFKNYQFEREIFLNVDSKIKINLNNAVRKKYLKYR